MCQKNIIRNNQILIDIDSLPRQLTELEFGNYFDKPVCMVC